MLFIQCGQLSFLKETNMVYIFVDFITLRMTATQIIPLAMQIQD